MDVETMADRFARIDVSKARVDVRVRPDGTAFGCATNSDGLGTLVERLKPLLPCLAVLEASGGYEGMVAATLVEASLPVAIVNPRQVRKFAGAIGRLAKTDAIDAAVIAHFAQAVRPAARPLPDDLTIRLAELMARRRQLVVMINAEKQGLARAHDRIAQRSFRAALKSREAEVRTPLYTACLAAIQHDPTLKRRYRRLRDAGKPVRLALGAGHVQAPDHSQRHVARSAAPGKRPELSVDNNRASVAAGRHGREARRLDISRKSRFTPYPRLFRSATGQATN